MMVAPALIALGVGYLVYISASKEKEGVKLLGQVIGIFVMIASVMAVACASMHCMKKSQCSKAEKSECRMMEKNTCPLAAQSESK